MQSILCFQICYLGGTWGEEDDTPDQSNVWTAPPANNAPGPNPATVNNTTGGASGQMQWGINNGPQQATNTAGGGMWNPAPSKLTSFVCFCSWCCPHLHCLLWLISEKGHKRLE